MFLLISTNTPARGVGEEEEEGEDGEEGKEKKKKISSNYRRRFSLIVTRFSCFNLPLAYPAAQ